MFKIAAVEGWKRVPKAGRVSLALAAPALIAVLATGALRQPGARAASPFDLPKAALPIPPANGEIGYVLTAFAPSIREGSDQCPHGLAFTLKEAYLETQPAAERERLLLKANEPELERKWKAYAIGPNGTNICSNADQFDRPSVKTVEARIAPGMDLDGDATGAAGEDTCSHENFTAPDGHQGVDNQAYRVLGCTVNWRNVDGKPGDYTEALNDRLANGEHTMVFLLRGVNSFVNDDNVDVVFASSDDVAITDTAKHILTNASFTVGKNPRWRNVLHGRIVNGVLITDPAPEMHTSQKWGQGGARGQRAEYDIRKGRFHLTFQPDGSLVGLMGGYQTIKTIMQSSMLGGAGAAVVAGIDCAGKYSTLRRLADGIKDPATGKCTAVSSSWDVKAVPAFVFDRPPTKQNVAAK